MADVQLDFYDLDADELPDVCMKCAAPAVVRPVRTFSWMPYSARWMPPIIGVWFIKRRRVPVPLCEQHKGHWTMRYLIGFGGLALFLILMFGGIAMLAADNGPNGPAGGLGLLCLAGSGVVFLAWLVTMIVLAVSQIGVFEITDDYIVLKNVSPQFVQAYREMTRGGVAPDVEDIVRESWGRPGGRPSASGAPRRRPPDLPPDDKYQRG